MNGASERHNEGNASRALAGNSKCVARLCIDQKLLLK